MSDLVEMVIDSVRVHMLSSQHVVILREAERDRYLPIWIGPWEANSIAMKLQGSTPERPLTHDLATSILGELGVTVKRVVIVDLARETFHARLVLEDSSGHELEIDSRPSDALAIAVRVDAPVFADAAVLERAGIEIEKPEPAVEEERLAIFRDFVNSLEVEGGDERPEGPGPGTGLGPAE
jgi:uncharacterized protein